MLPTIRFIPLFSNNAVGCVAMTFEPTRFRFDPPTMVTAHVPFVSTLPVVEKPIVFQVIELFPLVKTPTPSSLLPEIRLPRIAFPLAVLSATPCSPLPAGCSWPSASTL